MAIAYRASSEAHVASGSLTITIPAAVQSGDVLLLFGGLNDGGTAANDWATPAGWTLLDSLRVGSNLFAAAWSKVATAGDSGGSVTLSTSNAGKACAVLAAYSGADPVSPIDMWAGVSETVSTASHATPTVSTASAGGQVAIAAVQTDSATQSWGTATGYTKRVDSVDNSAVSGHVTATVQDKAAPTIGTYGGEALVAGAASAKAAMWTISLAPGTTTQVARPTSDIASSSAVGVPTPGAGSGLYARLAENVDTSYVQLSNGGSVQVGLAALTDPLSSSGHIVRYRAQYAGGATGGSVAVTLKQGPTTIASWTDTLANAVAGISHTLTAGQADAITNYGDLSLTFAATLS